jgi:hypothetical protein
VYLQRFKVAEHENTVQHPMAPQIKHHKALCTYVCFMCSIIISNMILRLRMVIQKEPICKKVLKVNLSHRVRSGKSRLTTGEIRCADHATPSIRKSWHYFAKKRRSLDRHSSHADQKPRSFLVYPIGLSDVEAPTFSRQSAHRWR